MGGFPPSKGNSNSGVKATPEAGPVSTGNGGLAASKKLKNSLTVPTAGVEKTNNAS